MKIELDTNDILGLLAQIVNKTECRDDDEWDPKGDKYIIVMTHGFVLTGNLHLHSRQTYLVENCSVIRRWGTKKGLGELIDGQKEATIYDLEKTVIINKSHAMRFLMCSTNGEEGKKHE